MFSSFPSVRCLPHFVHPVAEGVFTDPSPDGFSLRNHLGRPLFFQRGCALRPDRKNVAWHRENRFRMSGS